jgi:hypothetical protein
MTTTTGPDLAIQYCPVLHNCNLLLNIIVLTPALAIPTTRGKHRSSQLKTSRFIFLDSHPSSKKALIVRNSIYILNTGLTAIVLAKRRITLGIRGLGILAVISIIISSYALFFYFQNQTLQQVKSQLFDLQKQMQI